MRRKWGCESTVDGERDDDDGTVEEEEGSKRKENNLVGKEKPQRTTWGRERGCENWGQISEGLKHLDLSGCR